MADIIKQVQRGVGNLFEAFREQPKQAQTSRPAPRPAAVAQSAANTVNPITADKLRAGSPRVGEFSALGYYPVPAGVIHRIPEGRAVRMYLKAQAAQPETSGGAKTLSTPGIVASSQRQPSLPLTFHPDVSAWARVGGVWQRCQITGIDLDAEEVEISAPANTERTEVYYVHSDGEYRVRIYREMGVSDTSAATVLNGSIASMHLVDNNNLETAIRWPRYVGLVPAQRLVVEVNSSLPHVFNARAGHVVNIHAYSQRVQIRDPQALRRAAEIDMREGV